MVSSTSRCAALGLATMRSTFRRTDGAMAAALALAFAAFAVAVVESRPLDVIIVPDNPPPSTTRFAFPVPPPAAEPPTIRLPAVVG